MKPGLATGLYDYRAAEIARSRVKSVIRKLGTAARMVQIAD
jgi:hypothetical protein